MRFGSREQSVYPRPKNMPYIPTWREEEHSEVMTPESTTIPTCEWACVYVCVQCGRRWCTRRWWLQSQPQYLHVSVRACVYVCSVEGGGALGGDDPRVNHNTYMWVCVRVCMCAVWREVVHSEVMTPESTTIPTCEWACVYVCVQCGGRWCTRRWWPQSQPQYLHVSVRACVYVCSVEGGGALGGDDPRVNHNTYMSVCVCVCMCAVWREVVHSEVMTPESTRIPTCECACVCVCVQCGGRWCTRRWWPRSQPQYLHVSVRTCVYVCSVEGGGALGGDDPGVNHNTSMWVCVRVCMCAVWREVVHSEVMTPESTTIPTCECACVCVCVQCGGRWCTRRWWPQSQLQYLHVSVRVCMYVCSVEGGGALGGDDPGVNHNTYMSVCVRVCMCAVWREVVHSEVMTPESTTIPTCECACVCVCLQCGGRWCTRRWWPQSQPQYLHVSVRVCMYVCSVEGGGALGGDHPGVNHNTYMWVCVCVCMCAVWREVVHSEVITPESTTIPTCECACVRVCMCAVWREVVHSDRRWWPQNQPQYLHVSVRACMYVCSVEGGGALRSEVMTPESTTIPTCECACVYVCVQCGGRWCTRWRDRRWWPQNQPQYLHVSVCACMYVCSVEGGGALGSEVMTPESTTIPTCECVCVYVCVQCGGRWCTRRWWPKSQPQYLHVSVRACVYVCSVEGGGALGGDDPRVNHNTYMWVCVRVCMCAVWREVVHSEVMTPESTTIPTCECACVCVCVQCGGRWCTRRWWPQSQPQYLHVSVRACVYVCSVEGGGALGGDDPRVNHNTYMWVCVRVCMCAVWREVVHSELMTPESHTTVMYVYSWGRKSLLGSVVCFVSNNGDPCWAVLLPPANEVCEGYVFRSVCLSTGGWQVFPEQVHARAGTPPMADGQQAGGTHPIGMQSCFLSW